MLNLKQLNPKRAASLFALLVLSLSFQAFGEISNGAKLQTLINLHPDPAKNLLYTVNYQLSGLLIPVCSDVTIVKVKKKALVFEWKGIEYTLKWEKHAKNAGLSLMDVAETYFGETCPKNQISKMSKIDKQGIERGEPEVGMTRAAILIAMGPPPRHANPDLEGRTYMYWRNRFARRAVDFNDKGIVVEIR